MHWLGYVISSLSNMIGSILLCHGSGLDKLEMSLDAPRRFGWARDPWRYICKSIWSSQYKRAPKRQKKLAYQNSLPLLSAHTDVFALVRFCVVAHTSHETLPNSLENELQPFLSVILVNFWDRSYVRLRMRKNVHVIVSGRGPILWVLSSSSRRSTFSNNLHLVLLFHVLMM